MKEWMNYKKKIALPFKLLKRTSNKKLYSKLTHSFTFASSSYSTVLKTRLFQKTKLSRFINAQSVKVNGIKWIHFVKNLAWNLY